MRGSCSVNNSTSATRQKGQHRGEMKKQIKYEGKFVKGRIRKGTKNVRGN